MVGSSLAPKWPILVPFCGMDHQKSNFSLILALFLLEAVEANRCYFFENWVKKLKCPHLLKPLGTIFQHNYWSFYTSEPNTLARFNMRHPVHILLTNSNFEKHISNVSAMVDEILSSIGNIEKAICVFNYLGRSGWFGQSKIILQTDINFATKDPWQFLNQYSKNHPNHKKLGFFVFKQKKGMLFQVYD